MGIGGEPGVVLAHDWLTGFRGGEWILEALCQLYPEAPLYTLLHVEGTTSSTIENREIVTSFLNRVPGIDRHYRKFLPFFPIAVEQMRVREPAKVMISTSHCVIKGLKKPEGSYHLSYVHSPMRYMYDQFDSYFGSGSGAPTPHRIGAKLFRRYLTAWDRQSNQNVDCLVANSSFVRERIRKFYGRDAEVVHPFVEFADFEMAKLERGKAKEDFFLMVTAFAPNKRVDLAIEAFNEMKRPLKIVGGGQEGARLRRIAGPNIEFLGGVDRATVVDLMQRAQAFIFPGIEDFGITPLESLAAGTPVIAFRAGGVLETLEEADSVFFDEARSASLSRAVETFVKRASANDFALPELPNVDFRSKLARFTRRRFQMQILELIAAEAKA